MFKFNLNNKNLIKSCKPILNNIYLSNKKKYIDLFFYEKDVELNKFDVENLVKVKILKRIGNKYRANFQVFPLSGKFFVADFLYSKYKKEGNVFITKRDDVWGILPDETPVIAKKNITKKGDEVLDLATGQGMIGIFCSEKAKKVIATDINPKAINFSQFNAILNNVEDKIEYRESDLFEKVKGSKFDLIIWNGPTVALPEYPDKYTTFSYGGGDGAEFTRRFIDEAFIYLKPKGKLQWYDCAVGNNKTPVSVDYLLEKFKDKKVKITYNSLTTGPVSLKKSFEIYDRYNLKGQEFYTRLSSEPISMKEEMGWRNWLKKKEYNYFYYAIIEVVPSNKFSFKMNFPKKDIRVDRHLTQYWLWMSYSTILRKLKICESYSRNN